MPYLEGEASVLSSRHSEEFPHFNSWVHPFHREGFDEQIEPWLQAAAAINHAGIDTVLIAKLSDPPDHDPRNELVLVGIATRNGEFDTFYRLANKGSEAYIFAEEDVTVEERSIASMAAIQAELTKIENGK